MAIGWPEKIDRQSLQDFRDTFLTPQGRRTFTQLLGMLGYFSHNIETPGEMELRNFAARLIQIMAAEQPYGAYWLTDAILEATTHIPIPKEEKIDRAGFIQELISHARSFDTKEVLP